MALDGVSWVWRGLVEIAVSRLKSTACFRIGAVIHSLPGASLRSGARLDLLRLMLLDYAALNSVPCRSMACMMIARRRARAIRALRIVPLLAIANAQSLSFSGPL